MDGRVALLFALILAEGAGLILFSQMSIASRAVIAMLIFGLFTHMACGATYSLIPFVNRRALGGVAGIVGAGGNLGAVIAGFVVKGASTVQSSLFVLGTVVTLCAACALAVRFSREHKAEERRMYAEALALREAARLEGSTGADGAPAR